MTQTHTCTCKYESPCYVRYMSPHRVSIHYLGSDGEKAYKTSYLQNPKFFKGFHQFKRKGTFVKMRWCKIKNRHNTKFQIVFK